MKFKDLHEGTTLQEEVDEVTGLSRWVVSEPADEKHQPQLVIKPEGKSGTRSAKSYLMPSRAHLMVSDGNMVRPGDVLAKIPRETTKTKDITGGLPRVVELFEARRPHETAVITEVDGVVHYGDVAKGQRKILVTPENSEPKEYLLPRGVHVAVQEGERVKAGEPLMDGPRNPHDILAVLGEKELEAYLVDEIQEVYRLQGVNINDKHIEVIVRQMMRWVKVEEVGDTEFLLDEQVDKFTFRSENEKIVADKGKPATGRPLLLGITKASLSTDSFISAASFQETTRVLTEASIRGSVDHLRGSQGKRHHGPPDPRRNRPGLLPELQAADQTRSSGSSSRRCGRRARHTGSGTRRKGQGRSPDLTLQPTLRPLISQGPEGSIPRINRAHQLLAMR